MGALDRLLRKVPINNAYCSLYKNEYTKDIVENFMSKKGQLVGKVRNSFSEVKISEHAFERWNQRVGPFFTRVEKLERLVFALLSLPLRIEWLSPSLGIIDSDILFIYEAREETLLIKTFYGRCSFHPSLYQFPVLKKYNLHELEKINLSLPPNILEQQVAPVLPLEVILFNGRTMDYCIETYLVEEQRSCMYLKMIKKGKITEITEIDLNHPEQHLLNRSVLYVLNRLGYQEFVKAHLLHHKPDAVEESYQKHAVYMRERALKHE
ncbi:hypothetical protein RCG23_13910 [Neobacillus sp. PS3-34]|uniref:hypothetical protein n=1 Tax=Neobacillus sp. PS3-34 TaxID=3070678 RepID=UPI0027DEB9C6|nr:hypothetical protein [Neobacillus sp. PS3-34]WML46737.1 hypothetical protein RCG23_13910 [Neobacillus sp. PS3-34]